MHAVRPRRPPIRPVSVSAALACATAVALALAAATPAAAATVETDERCYGQGDPLKLSADGLSPRAPLTVSLDRQPLRYGDGSTPSADANGSFASSFTVPALTGGAEQHRHVLAVDDGTTRVRTHFTVTRPAGADFAPSRGNPRTLRARFSVWGFALERGRNARAWLHWIDPAGAVRKTALLGRTRGHCGRLVTARRRVFPFDARPGRWTLAIDTRRRYRSRAGGPRAKIHVHVRSLSL